MKLIARVDGGYSQKLRLATIGVFITDGETERELFSRALRVGGEGYRDATVAEWEAVFAGVYYALTLGATHLTLYSDRSDITGGQGRGWTTLKELAKPLTKFRVERGSSATAHRLATAGRKPEAEAWQPLIQWRKASGKVTSAAPWMILRQRQMAIEKAGRNRCYDPKTGRLVIHDLRMKFPD